MEINTQAIAKGGKPKGKRERIPLAHLYGNKFFTDGLFGRNMEG